MKKFLSMILSLSLVFCFIAVGEATTLSTALAADNLDVLLSSQNFPDENFLADLRQYNTNGDDFLSNSELEEITNLSFAYSKAESAEGIELLPYLETVTLFYPLKGLEKFSGDVEISTDYEGTVDLSGCAKIQKVTYYGYQNDGKVTCINLDGCSSLRNIVIPYMTALKEIKGLSTCTDLRYFDIDYSPAIKSLDFSGLTSLENLNIKENPLTGNLDYSLESINVSGCTGLSNFQLAGDYKKPVKSVIGLEECTNLEKISISYCLMSSLDLSRMTELDNLDLRNMNLSSLDITHNTKLTSAWLNYDSLTELDVSNCPELQYLNTIGNPIKTLDVTYCPKINEMLKTATDSYGEESLTSASYTNGFTTLYVSGETNIVYEGGTIAAKQGNLNDAKITLAKSSYKYTGKAITPAVTVTAGSKTLKKETDYTVTYANNTKVGNATVTITGAGKYAGTVKKTFKITKADNTLTVKAKTAAVKYTMLKKSNQTLAVKKILTVSKAKGTVTYSKSSGNKKITIAKKTGKVTVKKGLKKGTYKVKVVVKAAGNSNYKPGSKTVTFKVTVK